MRIWLREKVSVMNSLMEKIRPEGKQQANMDWESELIFIDVDSA